MPRRIAKDLQYVDPTTQERDPTLPNMDFIRASITLQNSGTPPLAVGYTECSSRIGLARRTLRHAFRALNLSSRRELPVNSSFDIAWFDPATDRLIFPDCFETAVRNGTWPVLFENPKAARDRYEHKKRQMAAQFGRLGGRGNKR